MKETKCQTCKHFDNEIHLKDSSTEMMGVCSKLSEVVFLNDKACKFYDLKNKSPLDIEVIEPIYVLPTPQMSMYEIIEFIK